MNLLPPLPTPDDLVTRLRKRAEIRRSIPRGEPDRISDLLEEAANVLVQQRDRIDTLAPWRPR